MEGENNYNNNNKNNNKTVNNNNNQILNDGKLRAVCLGLKIKTTTTTNTTMSTIRITTMSTTNNNEIHDDRSVRTVCSRVKITTTTTTIGFKFANISRFLQKPKQKQVPTSRHILSS